MIKDKVLFALKMIFLISPILVALLGQSIRQVEHYDPYFTTLFPISLILALLAMIVLLTLYIIKEIKRAKIWKLIFLVVYSLCIALEIYLGFLSISSGVKIGISTLQSVDIALLFMLTGAAAIFFTTESINQLKAKEIFENRSEKNNVNDVGKDSSEQSKAI